MISMILFEYIQIFRNKITYMGIVRKKIEKSLYLKKKETE